MNATLRDFPGKLLIGASAMKLPIVFAHDIALEVARAAGSIDMDQMRNLCQIIGDRCGAAGHPVPIIQECKRADAAPSPPSSPVPSTDGGWDTCETWYPSVPVPRPLATDQVSDGAFQESTVASMVSSVRLVSYSMIASHFDRDRWHQFLHLTIYR